MPPTAHARTPPARLAGAAAYLACSWTWCIGLFLPFLLLRDYGPWGFVAFAVPNVLGATAFAWVLARPGAPVRLLTRHRPAVIAFSVVTIAYQLFFLAWMTQWTAGRAVPIAATLAAIAGALCIWARRGWFLFALALYAFSLLTIARTLDSGELAFPPHQPLPPDLLWVAPVMLFGFALCPYLDPTFHHVRHRLAPQHARIAFTIAFPVLFLAIILFSAAYASDVPAFRRLASESSATHALILAHVAAQLGFTITAHLERVVQFLRPSPAAQALALLAMAAILALAALLPLGAPWDSAPDRISHAELAYRLFLAFYALVFPAYVWLCVIPTRDGHSGVTGHLGRRKRNVWLASVGAAAPLFWMGFIERREAFLPLALLLLLLARLALPRRA